VEIQFNPFFSKIIFVLLTKITFTYSELEDRILMSAMAMEGKTVAFWLTQRLCSRLVRALTAHLQRSVSRSALVEMGLQLSCQQREAEWQHKPSEPVINRIESLLVLPEKVVLSCSSQSAILLFPFDDGSEAQLRLNLQELRQLLAIVYRLYQHAGWPKEVWPEWINSAEPGMN